MTIVGVNWQTNDSSPTLTRIGPTGADLAGHIASWPTEAPPIGQPGGTAWDAFSIWGTQKRCNLWANGVVTAYCGTDDCYTDVFVENMGQCMTELEEHLYYIDRTLANHVRYYIAEMEDIDEVIRKADNSADYTLTTADIHPAFMVVPASGGAAVAKPHVYVASYEAHKNANNILDSRAGVTTTSFTAGTMAQLRGYAQSNGAGWENWTIQQNAELQLKFIVEYASLNSQSALGQGYCGMTAIQNTGATTTYENASYGVPGDQTHAMSYRGVENLWGNLQSTLEGALVANTPHTVWIAPQTNDRTTHPYGDSFVDPYVSTTYAMPVGLDYINAIHPLYSFIPATITGSSSTYLCDKGGSAGAKYLIPGGIYSQGAAVGLFELGTDNVPYGARLCYMP